MNEIEKTEARKKIHMRIWIKGIIATVIFTGLMWFFTEDTNSVVVTVQFITFFITWIVVHYLMLRKELNQYR